MSQRPDVTMRTPTGRVLATRTVGPVATIKLVDGARVLTAVDGQPPCAHQREAWAQHGVPDLLPRRCCDRA